MVKRDNHCNKSAFN